MNGAVVGSMRYYGKEYGLNYGVSIPTIRSLGRTETKDNRYAKYLFRQEVRELRLVSLWFAEADLVAEDLPFWARGIINSEVAEEAAFILFSKVPEVVEWLDSKDEVLQYCAVMAIAGSDKINLCAMKPQLLNLLGSNPALLPKAVIVLLESALKQSSEGVKQFLDEMPTNEACNNIREEMVWRM